MTIKHYEVLVTSAHTNGALAVIRSLGSKGLKVTGVSHLKNANSFYSKHCHHKIVSPDPEMFPAEYVRFILKEIQSVHYDALFPITDTDMYLISKYADEFLPYIKVAMNEHSKFMKVLDKAETIKIASKLKVPYPATIILSDISELPEISRNLTYPMIIKSRQSIYMNSGRISKGGTIYVSSPEELISEYNNLHEKIPFPLLQNVVQGEERGVFLLRHDGELKAIFAHKRLRSVNPLGGASTLRIGVDIDEQMKASAIKLLDKLDWEGAAMVEFKLDSHDNTPKLMEINGRFWWSLQLAIASGVDFPWLVFKTLLGEDITPVLDYKRGIVCRDLYNDFVYLYNMLFSRDNRFKYPKRLPAILEFLKFFGKNLVYDDVCFDDPKLTLHTLLQIIGLARIRPRHQEWLQ